MSASTIKRLMKRSTRRVQGTVRARVVEQYMAAGLYAVDVEVLNADDTVNTNWPIIQGLEVPRLLGAGDGTGVYVAIDPEAIVRVGFYDSDVNQPYLDAVIGSGAAAESDGKTLWIKAVGASIAVTPGGMAISAGTVSIGGYQDENGAGGDVAVWADNACAIEGEEITLGAKATQAAVLGGPLIDLLTALTVGGAPIDGAAALKAALQAQALSAKVKVE
jgi:hypothetical protein